MFSIKPRLFYAFTAGQLLLSQTAFADTHAQQEHLAAHIHGVAELTIAVESQIIELRLQAPAANIVGFEHNAKTKQENDKISKANTLLSNQDLLFKLSGAKCQIKNKQVNLSAVSGVNQHHHKKHQDHLADSKVQHKHYSHGDVVASYIFNCDRHTPLIAIDVNVFTFFPAIEHIKTMWISEQNYGSKTLTTTDRSLAIK